MICIFPLTEMKHILKNYSSFFCYKIVKEKQISTIKELLILLILYALLGWEEMIAFGSVLKLSEAVLFLLF